MAPFAVALVCLIVACAARADDRIFWINKASNSISFATIDGSNGGSFATGKVSLNRPEGLAFDMAAQRVYWANTETKKVSFASLLGSAGGDVDTGGLPVGSPSGLALDSAGGRIYWARKATNKIAFANLDGTFSDNVVTDGATVNEPSAVALDPGAGRIYWSNYRGGRPVSYANLDESGGGDLGISAVPTSIGDIGIAVDHANGRVYWADTFGNSIFSAGDWWLPRRPAPNWRRDAQAATRTRHRPGGRPDLLGQHRQVSYANLDGSGGGDLPDHRRDAERGGVPGPFLRAAPERPADDQRRPEGGFGALLLGRHLGARPPRVRAV